MDLLRPDDHTRPSMSLRVLLTELGSTVLHLAHGAVTDDMAVSEVVLIDPLDSPSPLEGAIVLGVGINGTAATIDLLDRLAEERAVGLVLRDPVGIDADIADTAARTGIPVFALSRGVGWVQVARTATDALGHSRTEALARGLGDPDQARGRFDAEYLAEIANATSHLIDAPVIVEDLDSRILAYSDDQDRADDLRKTAVLGTKMPEHYVEMFRARNVFKKIYADDDPLYLDDLGDGVLPRVVVRLAAGSEILGSMWVVAARPLDGEQTRALVEAARSMAAHLWQAGRDGDAERRARRAVLTGLLSGGQTAQSVAQDAGIGAGAYCAIGVDLAPDAHVSEDPRAASVRRARVANALALHLAAVHPGSVADLVGGDIYGVLHLRGGPADRSAYTLQVAEQFAERMTRDDVVVALGPVVDSASEISRSKRGADQTIRLIRSSTHNAEHSAEKRDGRRVVRSDDVRMDLLLLDMKDSMTEHDQDLTGPVAELVEWDRTNATDFIKTLDVFLGAFGDIARTAAILNVHPNTCRYRLRRIAELTGLDLADADARLGVMLQLRLRRL